MRIESAAHSSVRRWCVGRDGLLMIVLIVAFRADLRIGMTVLVYGARRPLSRRDVDVVGMA